MLHATCTETGCTDYPSWRRAGDVESQQASCPGSEAAGADVVTQCPESTGAAVSAALLCCHSSAPVWLGRGTLCAIASQARTGPAPPAVMPASSGSNLKQVRAKHHAAPRAMMVFAMPAVMRQQRHRLYHHHCWQHNSCAAPARACLQAHAWGRQAQIHTRLEVAANRGALVLDRQRVAQQ